MNADGNPHVYRLRPCWKHRGHPAVIYGSCETVETSVSSRNALRRLAYLSREIRLSNPMTASQCCAATATSSSTCSGHVMRRALLHAGERVPPARRGRVHRRRLRRKRRLRPARATSALAQTLRYPVCTLRRLRISLPLERSRSLSRADLSPPRRADCASHRARSGARRSRCFRRCI